jgi:hypothetical protein
VSDARRGHNKASRLRRLRRNCEERLAALGMRAPYALDELCAAIQRERGRPLKLIPMSLEQDHPCGIWVASDTEDLIFYEANTSRTHQEHIVGHELGHIIWSHSGAFGEESDTASQNIFPNISPAIVRDMLRRDGYTDNQEQEAETMASVILQQVHHRPLESEASVPDEASSVIARMERSLRHQPGEPR